MTDNKNETRKRVAWNSNGQPVLTPPENKKEENEKENALTNRKRNQKNSVT
jgi:hypothetical protein